MKIKHNNVIIPKITGAKKGGGSIAPNSLFSTDILYLLNAFGEGPLYRINPNGPQDIQINDSLIDDLLILDNDTSLTGSFDINKFHAAAVPGTIEQPSIDRFSDSIIIPQSFSSPVTLRKGNIEGIEESSITNQDTSRGYLDALRFVFIINELYRADNEGNVSPYTVSIRIVIRDRLVEIDEEQPLEDQVIGIIDKTITEKTDTPYKFTLRFAIPDEYKNTENLVFDITKTSNDSDDAKIADNIKFISWDEIINDSLRYPRTALIGYAIKAADEHTGGVPNFTSLLKGLIIKVPSNYNQPILSSGQIDWRQVEVPSSGDLGISNNGYFLQNTGVTEIPLTDPNPQIYDGVWDGTFVYAWTQNPVWIIYDILTNDVYGLGLPEENIDKYKFYQVAQYCDACDSQGLFQGVDGLADGSFRYKPLDYLVDSARQNQYGLPEGTKIKERRFILDVSITEQETVLDLLNKITSTFRGILTYAGGKITLAVDMPEEYPVMLFTDSNIQKGSIQFSGTKESDIITGIDASYIEPTNHFKREVISIRADEDTLADKDTSVEKTKTIDMMGVTRRSQAMRMAQYQLAASKYLRRMITFNAGADAAFIAPGDVIAVSTQSSGIVYGFGGRIYQNSTVSTSGDTSIYLEHFTTPSIDSSIFNTEKQLVLRILRVDTDEVDMYIIDKENYSLSSENVTLGNDKIVLNATKKGNNSVSNLIFSDINQLDNPPKSGDLWSLGEIEDINNYYTNKSDKLFKVTEVSRDPQEFVITINAIEYISEVYEDADTFINYEPVAYVDYQSAISTPPVPRVSLQAVPRERLDGSVVLDANFNTYTELKGYEHEFTTEYYKAYADEVLLVKDIISTDPLLVQVNNTSNLSIGTRVGLVGKNGFTSDVGKIELFCDSVSIFGSNSLRLHVPGLASCIDDNFTSYRGESTHILDAINYVENPTLRRSNYIDIDVKYYNNTIGEQNFVGYRSNIANQTLPIVDYDLANEYIYVRDSSPLTNNSLYSRLQSTPFCVTITQLFNYPTVESNSFYVKGYTTTHVQEGGISGTTSITIPLEVNPLNAKCVTAYVDGQVRECSVDLTGNPNTITINNLVSSDLYYRLEVIYHALPAIETGDTLEVSYANTYVVEGVSYDPNSSYYNATLTSNGIYKVYTTLPAKFDFAGYKFINTKQDVLGVITQINSDEITIQPANTVTTYNINQRLPYTIVTNENYERVFVDNLEVLTDTQVGNLAIKARNRNVIGRLSPFITSRTYLETLPIRKVENVQITESLIREQIGGVSVRVTCSFDHIQSQSVTEYEISYKISYANRSNIDYSQELTEYNTVQVAASGAENGKIRFSIPNVNRGSTSEANSITFRVTPLNKNIRGIPAEVTKTIVGKTEPPLNILNFTGGQQDTQTTFFWEYPTINNNLVDADLESVFIYRIKGDLSNYTQEQLLSVLDNAKLLVSVAVGSRRKSIPIDAYGSYTYLARTKDTSGNFSTSIASFYLKTTRPNRTGVVAAYSEDDPNNTFTNIVNNNYGESYYPSYGSTDNGAYTDGFTTVPELTDLLADGNATYITQVRDYGDIVTGRLNIDVEAIQTYEKTFLDFYTTIATGVSEVSGSDDLLVDSTFEGVSGIGSYLAKATYSPQHNTLIKEEYSSSGDLITRVYAIRTLPTAGENYGRYALIGEVVDLNTIRFSAVYDENGIDTLSTSFPEASSNTYEVIDLQQYTEVNSTTSYYGSPGSVTKQIFIRTSTEDSVLTGGIVDDSKFEGGTNSNLGYTPYEPGSRTFRHFQIKLEVTNNDSESYDLTLDKLRYTIEKEESVFTSEIAYTGTASAPYSVDYYSYGFTSRPVLTYTVVDAPTELLSVVTVSSDNEQASFRVYYSDGTGEYNGNATIMITAIGV